MKKTRIGLSLFFMLLVSSAIMAQPKFGGYLRTRFMVWGDNSYSFRFHELALNAKEQLNDRIMTHISFLIYGGSNFFIEHGYVKFSQLLFNGALLVGQTRNYCFGLTATKSNRITSNYGIVSEMFTHDRVLGIQYLAQPLASVKVNLGIFNGYQVGMRSIGDGGPNTVMLLADREFSLSSKRTADINNNKQVSVRVAHIPLKGVEVGLSASYARLAADGSEDIPTLNIIADSDANKIRFGFDLKYRVAPMVVQSEIYFGKTSELLHSAYSMLVGYIINPKLSVYGRYGATNTNIAKTTNQLTWELSQITLVAIYKLYENVTLQTEYEINMEKTDGSPSVNNNVFFVELNTTY